MCLSQLEDPLLAPCAPAAHHRSVNVSDSESLSASLLRSSAASQQSESIIFHIAKAQ
jgi:hypothetical protein